MITTVGIGDRITLPVHALRIKVQLPADSAGPGCIGEGRLRGIGCRLDRRPGSSAAGSDSVEADSTWHIAGSAGLASTVRFPITRASQRTGTAASATAICSGACSPSCSTPHYRTPGRGAMALPSMPVQSTPTPVTATASGSCRPAARCSWPRGQRYLAALDDAAVGAATIQALI